MYNVKTPADRSRQTKKYYKNAIAAEQEARDLLAACEQHSEVTRREYHDAQKACWNSNERTPFRAFEAVPTDDIENLAQWIDEFRRRVWGTAFSGGFAGKTGTRDMMLLLSLTHLMAEANTRVFSPALDDIVRASAMDHKTVVSGLESLRVSGFIDRHDAKIYSLNATPLPPLDECPVMPTGSLAHRLICGDRAHDAFGGRYGLKTTEIRMWVWMLINPGQTRYAAAKGAGVGVDTANRAAASLVEVHLADMDEDGGCRARFATRDAEEWLEWHTGAKSLYGKLDGRMKRMEYTNIFHEPTRLTTKIELDFE